MKSKSIYVATVAQENLLRAWDIFATSIAMVARENLRRAWEKDAAYSAGEISYEEANRY